MDILGAKTAYEFGGIVGDWIDMESHTVHLYQSIFQAMEIMAEYELDNLAVVNEEHRVIGIVSSGKIMKAVLKGVSLNTQVQQIMSTPFTTYYVDDPVNEHSFYVGAKRPVLDRDERFIGFFPSMSGALNNFFKLSEERQSLEHIVKMYEFCFDTAYEGITVVDQNGIIQLFNNSYSRYAKMKKEDAIGKHCTEVIENTRLPVVLETGIPERSNAVVLQGQEMVAHVIPLWQNNKVIGAIGMLVFEGVTELSKAFERIQSLKGNTNEAVSIEYPKKAEEIVTFDKIIGESSTIGEVKKIARRAAKTMATVLITGESGVGKELFAKSIHNLSPVKNGPLISINCASIPDDLLESELFGYEHGAFTGAKKGGKPGKFELAHNGTLFLDEIGDMSLHLQAKLLRVLQEQKFERIGGIHKIHVNMRIIAATNQPLESLVEEGKFRKDLYYRLHIISLHIPPLKNRKVDIPILVSHLLKEACNKHNIRQVEISREAMEKLIQYDWPGNIREMANLLESLVVLIDSNRVQLADLPPHIYNNKTDQSISNSSNAQLLVHEKEVHDERERDIIIEILQKVDGNKAKAAKILGIHRSTLYKKMSKYQLK